MLLWNTFLQMPKSWKYGCGIFVVLQLYFIAVCRETMPFYLYGMYSAHFGNEANQSDYFEVYINGEKLDWEALPTLSVVHVKNNILQYAALKSGEDFFSLKGDLAAQFNKFGLSSFLAQAQVRLLPQSLEETSFKNWLRAYLQAYWQQPIAQLQVYHTVLTVTHRKYEVGERILLF